jgi:hypothetical protein
MADHTYRVHLTTGTVQHVIASTAKIHGDHLVFVDSEGKLTALFLAGLVRSWNMVPNATIASRCQSRTKALREGYKHAEGDDRA